MMKPALSNVEIGREGQRIAEEYLREKGMEIVARNVYARHGEIDIIAKDGAYLVFVEVKLRKALSHGYPSEAVDYRKRKRMISAANEYIYKNRLHDADMRLDVVGIFARAGKEPEITHIVDAFGVG